MSLNGTSSNATFVTTGQKFGTGAFVGAADTNIQLPPGVVVDPSTAWTVECWVKMSAAPSSLIVPIGGAGYLGINTSGYAVFNITSATNATVTGTSSICDGEYHHIAGVYDGSNITIFVDGTSQATSAGICDGASYFWYIGCLNSSFNFSANGTYIDEVVFWDSAKYTANFTPKTSPYTGSEGMTALYHLDGNAIDSAGSYVSISPDSSSIIYSPGNWDITSERALSINAGAYFRVLLQGEYCELNFDISDAASPYSQIYYRLNDYSAQSPWTEAVIADSIVIPIPSNMIAAPYMLLEVCIKSTSETLTRWGSSSQTAVKLTAIKIQSGCVAAEPGYLPGKCLIFGDSITEGVRTVNETATNDTDRNDNSMAWSKIVGAGSGYEYGIVGFGAQGVEGGGSGSVPAFTTTAFEINDGVSRDFSDIDLVIINHGTNDGMASTTAFRTEYAAVIRKILAALPDTGIIVIMRTFSGYQEASVIGAVEDVGSPRVKYLDTTGWISSTYGIDSLGVHPRGPQSAGILGPKTLAALRDLIVRPVPTFSVKSA